MPNIMPMPTDRVVLDTNSLLSSLARRGSAYPVWKGFQEGRYTLCVTTEILEEYEEVIARKTTPTVAENVLNTILESENVMRIAPYFHLHLITADPDDDKFVDCAFAAQATYIVSNDTHYDVLKEISFPKILVLKLKTFIEKLTASKE